MATLASCVPHEVGAVVECAEGQAGIADCGSASFETIDHCDDACNFKTRIANCLNGAERRAARGHGVFDDDERGAWTQTLSALELLSGAVGLAGLPDVNGVDRVALRP